MPFRKVERDPIFIKYFGDKELNKRVKLNPNPKRVKDRKRFETC